jgi:hypothetical protein
MENSFVTLGLFIIDEFTFMDEDGQPTGRYLTPQGSWPGPCQRFFFLIMTPTHRLEVVEPMPQSELVYGMLLVSSDPDESTVYYNLV